MLIMSNITLDHVIIGHVNNTFTLDHVIMGHVNNAMLQWIML